MASEHTEQPGTGEARIDRDRAQNAAVGTSEEPASCLARPPPPPVAGAVRHPERRAGPAAGGPRGRWRGRASLGRRYQ